ncbi:MAG: DPP IV N-terminal domain-containing protein, partial [Proteobacteria bacterium]|nr:DPP IV N-terminal domain-containing protein [Pseudomonadota bacterium]
MADLTVERLFSDPPLTGHLPVQMKFSPDGRTITYLQVGQDDRERLDLWRYSLVTGQADKWIDARDLMRSGQATAAELAERERRRMFSSGITSYEWSPDSSGVLVPVDGVAWLVRSDTKNVVALTGEDNRQTDIRFSPSGRWISFVRDGDLYRLEVTTGIEQAITKDAQAGITNGLADFIAQEEMHRFHGYWWQPDETAIVFTRVDDSRVALSHRFEINADGFDVMPQRYPFAGATNAEVRLGRYQFDTGTTEWIAYADDDEDYLARVDHVADRLILQVQDRSQQQLKVKQVTGSQAVTLWCETSPTWINLHDNLKAADKNLVWTSQRDD